MIAQLVLARTQTFPSSPTNSTWRSKRAPLRRLADPGPADQPVAVEGRAQIIDLVPDHDPEIGVVMRRVGRRECQCATAIVLDPLHPDRIVDVAELVDVLGSRR